MRYPTMSSTYEISTERDTLVIRVYPPGADQESLQRLLDFLELEAVRKRSVLDEGQAEHLAQEVKEGAWQRVRHLFGAGGQRA